ncbi:hypothetical protein [Bacteroides sp.]|uniref:hypothetical protein n=3 Tax=Bacteroides sp. TaxID=29523 RepID=UPI002FC7B2B8
MTRSNTAIPGGEVFRENYVNNFIAVCNYIAAVNSTDLPALRKPVAHWNEYSTALINAKQAAIEWTNQIAANLKALPHDLIEKNEGMLSVFNEAVELCDQIIEDPTRKRLVTNLEDCIDDATRNINKMLKELSHVLELLKKYHDSLPNQAAELTKIANLAMADKQVDQNKIAELKQLIKNANSEINSLAAAIGGLSVALAASIAISVIAVAAAGPFGMVTWIFTGAIIATSIAFIAIDSQKIVTLKAKIKANQESMDDYTADVAALQNTADIFDALAKQAIQMEECVQFIVDIWEALGNDLNNIKQDIAKAGDNVGKKEWLEVKNSFIEATALWNTFIEKVALLDLDNVQANTSKLELGMTEEQVKAACERGETKDIIEYLTA